ncbi:MAG: Hpt domain-containing protein [Alphaproteobacteria bacterium]|nr:Hpt domain-containing protein [Alphaproteobacteria bacterium]
MSNNSVIDLKFLNEIIAGDFGFEKELLTIFADNAKRNFTKMEEAIKASDNNSWYMASHAFKGAAASIGAFGLARILENAQQYPENDSELKKALMKQINDELELVLEFAKSRS